MGDFLLELGLSQEEKQFQENFVITHKETGKEIIRQAGSDAFIMWWYIKGYCFGKQKVHAFPKIKTIAKDLGTNERTISRWLNKLEEANGIKRVATYLPNGMRTSNLFIINPEFPKVPESWENIYKHGAIKIGKDKFAERPNPSKIGSDKSVIGKTSVMTNLSLPENQGSKNDTPANPSKIGNDKSVIGKTSVMTNLSGGGGALKPGTARDNISFLEGEEKESFNKNNNKQEEDVVVVSNSKMKENSRHHRLINTTEVIDNFKKKYKKVSREEISNHKVNELADLAEECGKNLVDCLKNTVLYFQAIKTKPQNKIGALRYAITRGWDIPKKLPSPRREFRNYDQISPTVEMFRNLIKQGGNPS